VKSFIICLLLLIAGCSVNNSNVSVSTENNIRNVGTYYIVIPSNIPYDLAHKTEEILDANLQKLNFTKLKDKTSSESANYLISMDWQVAGNTKTLKITMLDNTGGSLKNVFEGSVVFKKADPLKNEELLKCGINKLFEFGSSKDTDCSISS
jgi:PBP1b-binding outer membrane lipoprotein LpoB